MLKFLFIYYKNNRALDYVAIAKERGAKTESIREEEEGKNLEREHDGVQRVTEGA